MDIQNRKIMICDDDQGILDVLEMILEPEGFDVSIEIDSSLVIDRIHNEKPDLLLLDLWMPALSGYDVIKQLKSKSKTSKLPIIVLSASRNEQKIALETGADKFLAKPFDIDVLVKMVNEMISY